MKVIESKIEAVMVYAEGARVRRVARVAPPTGPTPVRFDGLPLCLVDGSVRLSAQGAIVIDARVVVEVPAAESTQPPAESAELLAARREFRRLDGELAHLNTALAALAALAPKARSARDGEPAPAWTATQAARATVADARIARDAALRAQRVEALEARRVAHDHLAALEDAHARASTDRAARAHEVRKAVVATLVPSGGADAEARLQLEYDVPGARWAPTYTARLDGTRALLEHRAVIAQATGEDWRGVELVVSTAAQAAWAELPELPSLRIGRRQAPPARAGWRAAPEGALALYADYDAFARRASADADPPPTAVARSVRAEVMSAAEAEVDDLDDDLDGLNAAAPSPAPRPSAPRRMQAISAPAPRPAPPGAALSATAMAAPTFSAAPKKRMQMARSRSDTSRQELREGSGASSGAFEHEQEVDDAPTATDPGDLLAYGELRLRPPGDPDRGRLVRATPLERLGDAPAHALDEIRRAHATAQIQRPPPDGTQPGWSERYDHAFAAEGAIDVPADGVWHNVALRRTEVALTLQHVVVPRERPEVFRVAHLEIPTGAPLLAGPLDVYDGANFLLTTPARFTPPGGRVELGLGVDARIKVARNARYREDTAGLLRGALLLHHEVELAAENLGARSIELEVRERIPLPGPSAVDDVEVTVDRVAPAWEPWVQVPRTPHTPMLRGSHRWRVTLAAGARQTFTLAYTIKISGKHELVGGNRREA